jgi:leader peptidase (prepilin peptidase)/N-methyltransferase
MVIASAALGIWAALLVPAAPLLVMTCVLGWGLLVLSTVDALAFRLPDSLTLPLMATGIGTSLLLPEPDPVGHVVAAVVGIAIFYGVSVGYRTLRGRDGLGLGDAKLAGAAGAWLGWQALPSVVLLACCAGLVWIGIATIRRGKAALGERIPFGVALSFAIWLIWLYGPPTWPGTQP